MKWDVIATASIAAALTLPLSLAGCRKPGEDGRLRASGSFEVDKVRIVATGTGKLLSFPLEEGQEVALGQVVGIIDSEDLELKKKELEAGLDMARARLALVEKGVRPEDMKQLKAVKKEVKLQKDLAQKNVERFEQLEQAGGVSMSTLEEAQTKRDVAGSKLTQVQAQIAKAHNGAQDEEIDLARGAVAQIEAGIEQVDKFIRDRTVTAPSKGKVLGTFASEGEFVIAGQLIATVAAVDEMDLVVYVPENRVALVKLGDKAQVHVDSFPGKWFEGKVARIADEAEFTPSMVQTEQERAKLVFEVVVRVPNPEGIFKGGLPADAVFQERR